MLQRYALAHNKSVPTLTPTLPDHSQSPSQPDPSRKRARHANSPAPAQAPVQKTVAKTATSSHSDRSGKSGTHAPSNRQRRAQCETPAALADPLGAFAYQAGHKQRAMQSGLRLLKGKASQARVVSANLRPPRDHAAAQLALRGQEQQPANAAAKQATATRSEQGYAESREHTSRAPRPRQHQAEKAGQKQRADHQPHAYRPGNQHASQLPAMSSGCSEHSSPQAPVREPPQPKQLDSNYFQHVKSSLHSLIQAHHAIPSLHTMSDTDRAAVTTLLSNKLDGIDITPGLQQHWLPKPLSNQHPSQQPSTASSVDCTPSPESVAQQQNVARPFQLPKSALPDPPIRHSTIPPACLSNISHASAASSGSGQRHFTNHHTLHAARLSGAESFSRMLSSQADLTSSDIQRQPLA